MQYQVTRGGQMYGPYTLEDIQRYVTQGNILPTDLAKNDEMPNWIPVSELLGGMMPPPAVAYPITGLPYSAHVAPSAYPASAMTYPNPPNLHWLLVMLFSFLTCGIFTIIWNLMLSAWAKRVEPATKALLLYSITYIILLVNSAASFANSMPNLMHGIRHEHVGPQNMGLSLLVFGVGIGAWILRIVARFALANALEQHFNTAEPLGLRLNGVMTFFFGNLYFAYHISRLMEMKQAMQYRNPGM